MAFKGLLAFKKKKKKNTPRSDSTNLLNLELCFIDSIVHRQPALSVDVHLKKNSLLLNAPSPRYDPRLLNRITHGNEQATSWKNTFAVLMGNVVLFK